MRENGRLKKNDCYRLFPVGIRIDSMSGMYLGALR